MNDLNIKLKIIGIIHSQYKTRAQAPRQGSNIISTIEIKKEYEKGLTDIEEFKHVHVYYWLNKSKGHNLMVQTPWDIKSHGLFTTRSPNRPNPIGHSVVEIIKREKNILKVKNLDAIEGTPVIDIKPYVKKLDIKNNTFSGWISKTELDRD